MSIKSQCHNSFFNLNRNAECRAKLSASPKRKWRGNTSEISENKVRHAHWPCRVHLCIYRKRNYDIQSNNVSAGKYEVKIRMRESSICPFNLIDMCWDAYEKPHCLILVKLLINLQLPRETTSHQNVTLSPNRARTRDFMTISCLLLNHQWKWLIQLKYILSLLQKLEQSPTEGGGASSITYCIIKANMALVSGLA